MHGWSVLRRLRALAREPAGWGVACVAVSISFFVAGKYLKGLPPQTDMLRGTVDAVHDGGQLVALNSSQPPASWWDSLARLFAALAFFAFGFEVIRAVSSTAVEQVRLKWRRYAPWLRSRQRIAIIGSDHRADWLAREIMQGGAGEPRLLVTQVRDELIGERSALGPVLVAADPATDADSLTDLDLDIADQVVIMGSDDAVALARLNSVLSVPDNRPLGRPPRIVRVELRTPEVLAQVRSADWDRRPHEDDGRAACDVRAWNPDEIAARRILRRTPLDWRHPASRPGGCSELVCIGFGRAGRLFASAFIRQAHHVDEAPCRVTVIDTAATSSVARFRASHPLVDQVASIEIHRVDAFDSSVHDLLAVRLADPSRNVSVSVAIGNVDENLAVALGLSRDLASLISRSGTTGLAAPIFVRQSRMVDVAGVFARFRGGRDRQSIALKPWGGLDDACRPDDILESRVDRRAERIHAAFLAKYPPRPEDESNPLSSRRPWRSLWSFYRDDNRNCADYFESRLRAAGLRVVEAASGEGGLAMHELDPAELDVISRLEHRRWVVSRIMAGWRRGERSDADRRHPSVCGWDELSQQERDKDRLVSEALARGEDGALLERLERVCARTEGR